MSETNDKLAHLVEDLRRQRDELRVQLQLGKAEARDEWEKLEQQWAVLKPKLKAAGGEAAKASSNVYAALALAAEELKKGYERVRERLA